MKLPESLTLDAFVGADEAVSSDLAAIAGSWGVSGEVLEQQAPLAPGAPVDAADWAHPEIGWGVVLPEPDDVAPQEKARAEDAPEPIRELIAARGDGDVPILRYRADLGTAKLARYFADGTRQDPEVGLTPFGVARGRLPLYLLIVGTPTEIPWKLQFSLNRRHHVGRLDLSPEGLENYVAALLTDWQGLDSEPTKPVVWSVSFDSMTQKMETTLSSQIKLALEGDNELRNSVNWIHGDAATCSGLVEALSATKPSVVVTSSHGKTGPLDNQAAMRETLGLPVGVNQETLDADELLAAWAPSGAVWFAQACCSAGANKGTSYGGLLRADSLADRVVRAVGTLGPSVAPLPTRLLGAAKPIRAFVGHVEPTFDWTLIVSDTGQFLTAPLVDAVYPNLYRRWPIGLALDAHYRGVGDLYGKLKDARDDVDDAIGGALERATYYKLTATDRESIVILGDPTVAIPPLPSQRRGEHGSAAVP